MGTKVDCDVYEGKPKMEEQHVRRDDRARGR